MKLINMQSDVFVATDVSAVMVDDSTVKILLRRADVVWEYEYGSDEDAQSAAKDAIRVLMVCEAA